jgi:hypothetical protein
VDIARDEVGVSPENTMAPEEAEQEIRRITASAGGREVTPGKWSKETISTSTALEIPTFDRTWHPNEITGWLSNLECDEDVSEADLARARKAVSEALGVDD